MRYLAILLFILPYPGCYGQSDLHAWSIGVSGGHFDNDVGIMLSATAPFGFHQKLAPRISVSGRRLEDYFTNTGVSAYYFSIQPGIVYMFTQKDNVDVYGEAGINFIFPNKAFSNRGCVVGYYSLAGLGFSILPETRLNVDYFFEIGFAFNVVKAEKLEGQPHYCNGPIANTGLRFRLPD